MLSSTIYSIEIYTHILCYREEPALAEYHPRENEGENFGVGFFPILEIPGQTQLSKIVFPNSFALNTELCAMMQAMSKTCTVEAENFTTIWNGEKAPESNGTVTVKWPGPGKDPTPRKSKPAATPATGKSLSSSSIFFSL